LRWLWETHLSLLQKTRGLPTVVSNVWGNELVNNLM